MYLSLVFGVRLTTLLCNVDICGQGFGVLACKVQRGEHELKMLQSSTLLSFLPGFRAYSIKLAK